MLLFDEAGAIVTTLARLGSLSASADQHKTHSSEKGRGTNMQHVVDSLSG